MDNSILSHTKTLDDDQLKSSQSNLAKAISTFCLVLTIIFSFFMVVDILMIIDIVAASIGKDVTFEFEFKDTESEVVICIIAISTIVNFVSWTMGHHIFNKVVRRQDYEAPRWFYIFTCCSIIAFYTLIQIPFVVLVLIYYQRQKKLKQPMS
jgi:hypothetical protein